MRPLAGSSRLTSMQAMRYNQQPCDTRSSKSITIPFHIRSFTSGARRFAEQPQTSRPDVGASSLFDNIKVESDSAGEFTEDVEKQVCCFLSMIVLGLIHHS